eukprot:g15530.t1
MPYMSHGHEATTRRYASAPPGGHGYVDIDQPRDDSLRLLRTSSQPGVPLAVTPLDTIATTRRTATPSSSSSSLTQQRQLRATQSPRTLPSRTTTATTHHCRSVQPTRSSSSFPPRSVCPLPAARAGPPGVFPFRPNDSYLPANAGRPQQGRRPTAAPFAAQWSTAPAHGS